MIPVKCFTCGNVLADKYRYYLEKVKQKKIALNMDTEKVIYLTKSNTKKTPEGDVLDEIGLHDACCRRHMITQVDIE